MKEILSHRINFAGRATFERYNDTEFSRVIEVRETVPNEETGVDEEITRKAARIIASGSGTRKSSVILVPMKSLSLEDFTYPFTNATKIREALRLQVMPYTAAGELELFPVILNKTGRNVNGIVWYSSPDELDMGSLAYASHGNVKVWPAPLPFISQLAEYNGSGVTMWLDEENVCSLLWQSNKPVLYRWKKLTGEHPEEKELAWYDSYCKARELDRGGNFIINASGETDEEGNEEFYEIVNDSVKTCSWIANVNLSRSALEGARDLERTVRLLTRASCWLLLLGAVTLGACIWKWSQVQGQVHEVRTRSENYYRQTFDPTHTGRVANPVTLARDKIAEISGAGTEAHPIEEVLADLGEIFLSREGMRAEQSMDITMDIIRYNSEGIDCTGSAPDMTTILNFRKAWESRASLAQVDNTQFVSGIGYRFDLRVRW